VSAPRFREPIQVLRVTGEDAEKPLQGPDLQSSSSRAMIARWERFHVATGLRSPAPGVDWSVSGLMNRVWRFTRVSLVIPWTDTWVTPVSSPDRLHDDGFRSVHSHASAVRGRPQLDSGEGYLARSTRPRGPFPARPYRHIWAPELAEHIAGYALPEIAVGVGRPSTRVVVEAAVTAVRVHICHCDVGKGDKRFMVSHLASFRWS
jgi:hypothetical protein